MRGAAPWTGFQAAGAAAPGCRLDEDAGVRGSGTAGRMRGAGPRLPVARALPTHASGGRDAVS
jgi:hypothetical protein